MLNNVFIIVVTIILFFFNLVALDILRIQISDSNQGLLRKIFEKLATSDFFLSNVDKILTFLSVLF